MKIIHVICIHENDSCGGDTKMQQYTLKELRARKNETQEQTAKALGVSTRHIMHGKGAYQMWL